MSSFGGTKKLIIVIDSNKYYSSTVFGCFMVLYITAGLLLLSIVVMTLVILYHRVKVKQNLNRMKLARGKVAELTINFDKNNK